MLYNNLLAPGILASALWLHLTLKPGDLLNWKTHDADSNELYPERYKQAPTSEQND